MKKAILICLSVIAGIICYFFTFAAAFKYYSDYAYIRSYLGVIIPIIVLEIIKYVCYKPNYKKIYSFDIISTSICLLAIIIINSFYSPGKSYFWTVWKKEFFLLQFPWFIMLFAYIFLLIFKSKKVKKTDKKMELIK